MKSTLKLLSAITLLLLSTLPARGQGYVGGSLGFSAITPSVAENSIDQWNALNYGPGNDCATLGCYVEEEGAGALKIFGGYQVNSHFAVEGFFAYLGSFDSYADDGFGVTVFDSTSASTFGIAAVGLLPLGSGKVSLLGKLGLHSWSAEEKIDLWDAALGTGVFGTFNVSGTDGMGGIGVQMDISEQATMRVEFEYFAVNTDFSEFGVGMLSIGGMYKF